MEASGLLDAAQRLLGAALQLVIPGGDVHPPLAADETSAGAAARLSSAGAGLLGAMNGQAASLLSLAEHIAGLAGGFTSAEDQNAARTARLALSGAGITTFNPLAPLPALPPDVRPAMPPPVIADGEAVATQLAAGSASAGAGYIATWRARAAASTRAAETVRGVLGELPELWSSPVGTQAAGERLQSSAQALSTLAERAEGLAQQASTHAGHYQTTSAVVPSPAEFADTRQQLELAQQANVAARGAHTPVVSALRTKLGELQQQALKARGEYHAAAEAGTAEAPTAAADADRPGDPAARDADRPRDSATGGPEPSGQLSSQLVGMLPQLLGAVGGMAGGAVGMVGQLPQSLMQTGQGLAQAMTGMAGGLGGSKLPGLDAKRVGTSPAAGTGGGAGKGGGGGGSGRGVGGGGGGPVNLPPVTPSTAGSPPPAMTTPMGATGPVAGAGADPASGARTASTPMGGMMHPGLLNQGQQGAPDGQNRAAADRKLVVPAKPHTESVTGRVTPDRIATTAASRPARDDVPADSPADAAAQEGARPAVRRITLPPRREEGP
ncbi:PPE domain-containing protein [Mycobacterium sp. MYCO198283]|uniref:PPE domain-containing protein n=1 Tax=Mycobacterium sp. MYCO198283 TaxID=2883505 RepID=UPI001E5C8D6C|nr:PPE domain-containing protein [Mycobacterium sp. MYCO198283]MCG5433040.1 PPE domain-containing protein [Mycobacterium sp. MYCO198283]